MSTYIQPPKRTPFLLSILLKLVEWKMGKKLIANRILTWYPKAAIGSGLLESLVAHKDKEISVRLLKLIRVYTSILVSCAFCIDLNSKEFKEKGLTENEIQALQGIKSFDEVETFSKSEIVALRYVECICKTPVSFTKEIIEDLKKHYSDRAIVIIASTSAQVNFWGRLIQSFGVMPAGFTKECTVLNLDDYKTLH